jgi:protein-S-isoprenylcysteine O-methyltransferase Ste14
VIPQFEIPSHITPQVAANVMWLVWYSTWLLTVVWQAKTKTRKIDRGVHRLLTGIGAFCMFVPATPYAGPPDWTSISTVRERLWPASEVLDWSLFGLTALGFLFCWWARIHLGRLWSLMVTVKDEHRVVDTGPYGIVRHPIYSGVMVSAVATALLRASPLAMIGAVLFSIGFALTAVVEEKFLREQLGAEAYDAYSRRVGMLIPKLG